MLSRDIYQCYTFQKVPTINNKRLNKICENDKYIIYRYKETNTSDEYIIGSKKNSPNKYFKCGENYDYVCLFNNFLFLCNRTAEVGSEMSYIYKLNLSKKIIEVYNLRSNFGNWISRNGFGRFYTTEEFNDVIVLNDSVIISGHREKSKEDDFKFNPENKETDFEIIFKYDNNDCVPYYKENKNIYPFKNDILISKGKPDKSDDPVRGLAIFLGCFLALLCSIIGLIGNIVTHFKMPIWIAVLCVGIVSFIVLFRLVVKRVS